MTSFEKAGALQSLQNAMFIRPHNCVLNGRVAPLWVKLPGKFDSSSLAKPFEARLDAKWFPLFKVRTQFGLTFQLIHMECHLLDILLLHGPKA